MSEGFSVPRLFVDLPFDVDGTAIYEDFRRVLEVAPMPKRELAEEVGVSDVTIGRWARGESRPSVEHMARTLQVVGERLEAIESRLNQAQMEVEAVEAYLEARDAYSERRDSELQEDGPPLDAEKMEPYREEVEAAEERLREVLPTSRPPEGGSEGDKTED